MGVLHGAQVAVMEGEELSHTLDASRRFPTDVIAFVESGEETGRLPESLAKGSACASEAFFPFPDGLIQAADAGATAVIQPGGSVNDQKVIDAADEKGLAMVFTGMRHFRH